MEQVLSDDTRLAMLAAEHVKAMQREREEKANEEAAVGEVVRQARALRVRWFGRRGRGG